MRQRIAVILCGGASQRMQTDKNYLQLGNRLMLPTVVERVAAAVAALYLVKFSSSQPLPDLPPGIPLRVVSENDFSDPRRAQRGPATAIANAYQEIVETLEQPLESCDVFLTGNDYPMLKSMVVQRLFEEMEDSPPEVDAVIPIVDEKLQVLCCVLRGRCLTSLPAYVEAGGQSLYGWLEERNLVTVSESSLQLIDPHLHSFLSVNSPETFQQVCDLMTGGTGNRSNRNTGEKEQ